MSTKELTATEIQTLEWFTVREVANRWGVDEVEVVRLIDAGALPAGQYGAAWRVHRSVVERGRKVVAA